MTETAIGMRSHRVPHTYEVERLIASWDHYRDALYDGVRWYGELPDPTDEQATALIKLARAMVALPTETVATAAKEAVQWWK